LQVFVEGVGMTKVERHYEKGLATWLQRPPLRPLMRQEDLEEWTTLSSQTPWQRYRTNSST